MNKWKIVALLLVLFFIDLILVITGNSLFIDKFLYSCISSIKSDFMTDLMLFITNLASTRFLVLVNVGLLLICVVFKKYKLLILPISSLISVVINNLFKLLIARDRPLDIALIEEKFYSFPSGHSMIAIMFYGAVIYLVNRYKIRGYKYITVALIFLIFFVGVSRIYLGVHFATDVLGGWLLASALLIVFTIIWENCERKMIK